MSVKESKKINFAKAYGELQKIVEKFESKDIDLEEGIKDFEAGLKLVGELKSYLNEMQNKVNKIKQKFSQSGAGHEDGDDTEKEDGTLF